MTQRAPLTLHIRPSCRAFTRAALDARQQAARKPGFFHSLRQALGLDLLKTPGMPPAWMNAPRGHV